ncbi:DUF4352 domain-containing protein [Leucobacter musarum]|uniref:DUF4352 domain-containing protein n=1 Tax=Leucobacter musarum TaxID=1930747 RepID=UPI0009E98A27|nr:DUF4352 domain-containing protein [Leucobacter musarum]
MTQLNEDQQFAPVPPAAPTPQYAAPAPVKKEKNVLGLVAFVVAVVGFVFACIPGALILGWVLLPIAFILSLVSLFLKGKGKGFGITALILSVVGTLVGVIVFVSVVATSFDEAFSGGDTTITTPEGSTDDAAPAVEESASDAASTTGTREAPLPIGTVINQGDWSVTVNSVNLNATDAITAENPFNQAAPEGSVYILANVTATYTGDDANGSMPLISVAYVTADGNTIETYESVVLAPEPFDFASTLYAGASATGNIAFAVPADTAAQGVLAVTPNVIGDKAFVAVQ